MFDATLRDRELSFQSAPGTTMFLHWLVGMVYVFYFASFILLLREVRSAGERWHRVGRAPKVTVVASLPRSPCSFILRGNNRYTNLDVNVLSIVSLKGE